MAAASKDTPEGEHPPSVREFRSRLQGRLIEEHGLTEPQLRTTLLVFNLSRLLSRLSQDFEAMHRPKGLTWAGFRIMNVLWAVGPVELRDVARLTGSSRASISSALNTLERDGLVRRTRANLDKRQVRISLTERGHGRLEEAIPLQFRQERRWFDILSAAEQKQLAAMLTRVADQSKPG